MTIKSVDEIRSWLTGRVADILGCEFDGVDPAATFDSFGLASRDAVSLSGDLEDWLGLRLSPTLLYQYSTIDSLARHLAEQVQRAGAPGTRGAPDLQAEPAGPPAAGAGAATLTDEEANAALEAQLREFESK